MSEEAFIERTPEPGRRKDDRARAEAVRAVEWFRQVTIRALVAYAIVSTVACGALVWALLRSEATNRGSRSALSRSTAALVLSGRNEARIAAEAAGLCGALDDGRRTLNVAHGVIYRTFLDAGNLQLRAARSARGPASPAVRGEIRLAVAFADELIRGARAILALPPLDCTSLAARPREYKLPEPVPISRFRIRAP